MSRILQAASALPVLLHAQPPEEHNCFLHAHSGSLHCPFPDLVTDIARGRSKPRHIDKSMGEANISTFCVDADHGAAGMTFRT
jgi:hypothetical protein